MAREHLTMQSSNRRIFVDAGGVAFRVGLGLRLTSGQWSMFLWTRFALGPPPFPGGR